MLGCYAPAVKAARELLGLAGICALAWLAFTCGESRPSPAQRGAPAQGPAPGWSGDPPTHKRGLVDDLRAARDQPRHSSDGGGRAWLDPLGSTEARAGEPGRWTIVYEAGTEGIEPGGFVRLTVPGFWDWTPAQTQDPEYPGYTTVASEAEGVELETRDFPGRWVDFGIAGRKLESGQSLRIVYGAGPAGARADRYAERGSRFWITVDGDGDGFGRLVADCPAVDVAPGPAEILSALLPSTAQPGDTLLLRLAFLDGTGSMGAAFEGQVSLLAVPEGLELPATVEFSSSDGGLRAVEIRAREKGVYRLGASARDERGEFTAETNPLLVEQDIAPIRWGDLHGHSNFSDGTGLPEDYLRYARDVAGLDAIALTDHDHWGMLPLDQYPELWAEIQAATERFHSPGRFVTILGYEWTNWIHGHRHVLYFGEPGPVLSSIDERYETPAQLWDALRGQPVLTFAHHSAGGPIATNWEYAPDPVLEPVTEVASVHGASEASDAPQPINDPVPGNFVRDVLARGYRLGFIGSGDSHDGHPGLVHLFSPYMGGLAAILTKDLTREGIRSALAERRCYATNGPRILLRCALDGKRMGSSLPPREGPALLYVRAIACAPIAYIELVRGAAVVETRAGEEHWDVETAFEPTDLKAGEYLYVRVIQTDGGAAWSSPFFVQ